MPDNSNSTNAKEEAQASVPQFGYPPEIQAEIDEGPSSALHALTMALMYKKDLMQPWQRVKAICYPNLTGRDAVKQFSAEYAQNRISMYPLSSEMLFNLAKAFRGDSKYVEEFRVAVATGSNAGTETFETQAGFAKFRLELKELEAKELLKSRAINRVRTARRPVLTVQMACELLNISEPDPNVALLAWPPEATFGLLIVQRETGKGVVAYLSKAQFSLLKVFFSRAVGTTRAKVGIEMLLNMRGSSGATRASGLLKYDNIRMIITRTNKILTKVGLNNIKPSENGDFEFHVGVRLKLV
ncbi:MAG: hypothetical protein HY286_15415 [Planctomycetes bacterium]|nr:hypothetical protein [Planctomycetota bacterium]